MTHVLLAISIGPVQEFIAASRKARDLWRGSSLLSDVCRDGALAIQGAATDGHELEMIFPTADALKAKDDEQVAIANKLLVLVHGDASRAQVLADICRRAAQDHLEAEWRNVWSVIRGLDAWLDAPLADAQIADFLEFYAAWWPLEDPDQGYEDARTEVERLLAGRKATRDFKPLTVSRERRPKSSLNPARESIIRRFSPPEEYRHVQSALHLRGSEQLDAVSVIKRLSQRRRFVSTSRVAIDPFLRRVLPDSAQTVPEGLQHLQDIAEKLRGTDLIEPLPHGRGLDHFSAFPYDSQLFYTLPREVGNLESTLTGQQRDDAKAFALAAQALKKTLDIGEFPSSYVILIADGDNMGKALNEMDKLGHRTFSEKLNRFAQQADGIVRDHFGALLYSGGDDVVAFLPVDTAIPCVAALRLAFQTLMIEAQKSVNFTALPTLSAGLAIVHFREHLQVAMDWAREAEREAKNVPGKNALAVHLHTHSGGAEALKVVHTWRDDLLETRWARWVRLHRQNDLPDAAAFELRRLHRELSATHLPKELLQTVLPADVRRILERKRGRHGADPIPRTDMDAIVAMIGDHLDALHQVTSEILIARRLATVIDLADRTAIDTWNRHMETPLDAQTPKLAEVTA